MAKPESYRDPKICGSETCWYCKQNHKPEDWCYEKWAAFHRVTESLRTGRKPRRRNAKAKT